MSVMCVPFCICVHKVGKLQRQDIFTHVQKERGAGCVCMCVGLMGLGMLVVQSSHQGRLHNSQQAASTTSCIVGRYSILGKVPGRKDFRKFSERTAQRKKWDHLHSVDLVSPQWEWTGELSYRHGSNIYI